jgi:hypothetical protein
LRRCVWVIDGDGHQRLNSPVSGLLNSLQFDCWGLGPAGSTAGLI